MERTPPTLDTERDTPSDQLHQGRGRHLSYTLLAGSCLLCGLGSKRNTELCAACEQLLPRLGPHCPSCAIPQQTQHICGECLARPPHYRHTIAAFCYLPPVSHLITRYKVGGHMASGRLLSTLLATRIADNFSRANQALPDLLISVPMHWRRRFQRGFNQSELIAEDLAAWFDIPLQRRVLLRRAGPAQHQLSRTERQRSRPRAYSLRAKVEGLLQGKHIALVDDVMTTGSTANTLARLLRRAGASAVDVWVVARTPRER